MTFWKTVLAILTAFSIIKLAEVTPYIIMGIGIMMSKGGV